MTDALSGGTLFSGSLSIPRAITDLVHLQQTRSWTYWSSWLSEMFVTGEFTVRHLDGSLLEREDLHRQGENIMDALLEVEAADSKVSCVSTATDAHEGTLVVEMTIEANEPSEAEAIYYTAVRTAIHAAGGTSPGSLMTRSDGPLLAVPASEYETLREIAYLVSSSTNARRLFAAIDRLENVTVDHLGPTD